MVDHDVVIADGACNNVRKRRSPRRSTKPTNLSEDKRKSDDKKDILQLFTDFALAAHEDDLWSNDTVNAACMKLVNERKRKRSKKDVPLLSRNFIDSAEKFMVTSLVFNLLVGSKDKPVDWKYIGGMHFCQFESTSCKDYSIARYMNQWWLLMLMDKRYAQRK